MFVFTEMSVSALVRLYQTRTGKCCSQSRTWSWDLPNKRIETKGKKKLIKRNLIIEIPVSMYFSKVRQGPNCKRKWGKNAVAVTCDLNLGASKYYKLGALLIATLSSIEFGLVWSMWLALVHFHYNVKYIGVIINLV